MENRLVPEIDGNLRKHMIRVPKAIEQVSGIRIFGKLIKSLVFTTDVAIIRNCNAITYTPPSNGDIFKAMMNKYRNDDFII